MAQRILNGRSTIFSPRRFVPVREDSLCPPLMTAMALTTRCLPPRCSWSDIARTPAFRAADPTRYPVGGDPPPSSLAKGQIRTVGRQAGPPLLHLGLSDTWVVR